MPSNERFAKQILFYRENNKENYRNFYGKKMENDLQLS